MPRLPRPAPRAEARAVLLNDRNICETAGLTITAARSSSMQLQLSPAQTEIAGKILEEVRQRIGFLEQVGLEYLTLDRLSSTLCGGESQRIQLATRSARALSARSTCSTSPPSDSIPATPQS